MNKILFLSFQLILIVCAVGQSPNSETITIEKILIEGNFRTRANIITRELSISEGDTFYKADIDSIFEWNHNRIYNTNLFNVVDLTLTDSLATRSDLLITVEERWYLYPAPIFRLIDRNFNEWWVDRNRDINRVNIGIKLDQFNLTGRNDLLRIIAQTGFTNIYTLNYRLPYIEKTQRHGLEVFAGYSDAKNLAFTSQDNNQEFLQQSDSVLRRELGFSLTHTYRSGFYAFHETSLSFSNAVISDTILSLNNRYFGNGQDTQSFFRLGYVYKWDKRNNRN
ncbi:MAG: POTRA domain-containing protein, partial [Bacteroidota bacterium]